MRNEKVLTDKQNKNETNERRLRQQAASHKRLSYRQKMRVVCASGRLAATARMSLIPWSMKSVVAGNGCGRCGGIWRSGSFTRQYEEVV